MPSNLSADERAAVEWVTKNVVEAVEEGARFPLNDDDARHLRTLLAVVARAGEPVAWGIASPLHPLLAPVVATCLSDTRADADARVAPGAMLEGWTVLPLYAHPADARDRGDAVRGVLLAFHDWPAHSSAFADGERRRALDTLAATMHAAPAAPEDK